MSNNNTYNGRAKLLAKLLNYLFLLSIGTTLASMFLGDVFAAFAGNLYWPGVILDAACTFGYSVVLLRMAAADNQYRTAGYCILIAGAIRLLGSDVSENASKYVLLLNIATAMVRFIGEYNEMTAHDNLLIEADIDLSEKWTVLRKWYMIVFGIYCISLLVMMLIPAVGAVISLVSSLAMIVISILKIYFLYRSSKVFAAM